MCIEIRHRFSGKLLISVDARNLRGANLRGADMRDADMRDANLIDANLIGANLRGADLRGANLRGADLENADLRGANLRGADLENANLRGAKLRGADLENANLRGANLIGANLIGANLRGEIISKNPVFITGLNWPVCITDSYMKIGCQHHTHAKWTEFSDQDIQKMESKALEFWRQWRDCLISICANHKNGGTN